MAYRNVKGASRERAMLAAYVLVNDLGARQADVARVLRNEDGEPISQSTVSKWVEKVGYEKRIRDLTSELNEVRALAHDYHLQIEHEPMETDELSD